jgi:hypothetical protein
MRRAHGDIPKPRTSPALAGGTQYFFGLASVTSCAIIQAKSGDIGSF